MMPKILLNAALAAAIAFAPALASAQDKKPTAQQQRMKSCNAEASGKKLKGDERKAFMSSCLKGEAAAAKPAATPQQQKMKDCNKQAGDKKLKGAERKSFMSACLKG